MLPDRAVRERAASPEHSGLHVATASLWFEEPERQPALARPGTRAAVGALAALVALLVLSLLPGEPSGPTPEPTRQVEARSYRIHDSGQVGELMIFVGSFVGQVNDRLVDVFTINNTDRAEPVDIVLGDGRGHTIDVQPAGMPVPAKTIEHRRINAGSEFDVSRARLQIEASEEAVH